MKFSLNGFFLKESNLVSTQKSHIHNTKETDFEEVTILISDIEIEKLYQRMKSEKENN